MAIMWHYAKDKKQLGPVTQEELLQLVQRGTVGTNDPVWTTGMAAWLPAGRVPPFEGILNQPGDDKEPIAPVTAAADPVMLQYSAPNMEGLLVTHQALEMLRLTRPWVRFLGILLWIGAGFLLIGGVVVAVIAMAVSSGRGGTPPGEMGVVGVVYACMAGLYIAPAVYLNRYASNITKLLTMRRSDFLESALGAQKSFWKFVGVCFAIFISLYLVIMIIAMLFAVLR